MKPRIVWSGVQWMCHSKAIFGARVIGFGETPLAAYKAWRQRLGF